MDYKKYYKNVDLIRAAACLAILLYHLNIAKGGYLAVCTFFVLSAYLSCISAFRKERFSMRSYYGSRLRKVYLPLLIVVFVTVSVLALFPDIVLFNIKPETTSIVCGYNNFWQLDANLDYFARHVDSPFMHLWYIAILLQFDLVFPFLYLALRKLGDSIHKMLPCVITMAATILPALYFLYVYQTQGIMIAYYHTFTRIFALLFGLFLGCYHSYYGALTVKPLKEKRISECLFYGYLFLLTCLCMSVEADSNYFAISMIFVTLLSGRLIDYGILAETASSTWWDRCVHAFAGISYEVYLLQYPILFLFQYVKMQDAGKMLIVIPLILVLAYLMHGCMQTVYKSKMHKEGVYALRILVCCMSMYGVMQYVIMEDHSAEMKQLKEQLAENEAQMQKKQREYAALAEKEKADWDAVMKDLKNGEENVKDIVAKLPVAGVGDSVMLGAVENLYQAFPNGYFDAKVSRTAWVANDVLQELYHRNMLQGPVIINLGANGDCPDACKADIMKTCEGHEVFWINVTNDAEVHFNDKLVQLASQYDHLHVVDWYSASKGHPEYFVADGIHLTQEGRQAYTKTIYDSIYEVYQKDYRKKKEEALRQHDEKLKSRISFYGNDLLLSAYADMQEYFADAKFIAEKDMKYADVKRYMEEARKEKSLTHQIVFAFDHRMQMSLDAYRELITLCDGCKLYIVSVDELDHLKNLQDDNVTVITFYEDLQLHKDYVMADGVHLSEKGNEAISKRLQEVIHAGK